MNIANSLKYIRKFGPRGLSYLIKAGLHKHHTLQVDLANYKHPIFLRNNTSDIPTFHKVIYGEDYALNLNFSPEVIIDCGANIGLASVFFKNLYPEATVIAVEPEPSNFEMLVKNTKGYQNIHCLNNGIWNRSVFLKIEDQGLGHWGYITRETEKQEDGTVSAISIDSIMTRYGLKYIDILKIDIEGSEKELFEKNFEKWLPYTKIIMIELHDRMKKDCSKTFFKALLSYDFSIDLKGENIICMMDTNLMKA